MDVKFQTWKKELSNELDSILNYWIHHTPDQKHGGFYGKISGDNNLDPFAPKGSVLNSRILYTFSEAYRLKGETEYLAMADRAFNFLIDAFTDPEYGGIYWTVNYTGKPLSEKKQLYAQAFALYALCSYYRCRKSDSVKEAALQIFHLIETNSFDSLHGGYYEAFDRNWSAIDDNRLSEKDSNDKKTMNTHLHILEAYTAMYELWPNAILKDRLESLIQVFLTKIISDSGHLNLFFSENWTINSSIVSYGHDIEASWLLYHAARVLDNNALLQKTITASLQLVFAAKRGLDSDGGLWYEKDLHSNEIKKEKHWWPQAEAMVAFYYAWKIHGESQFLIDALNSWEFIKTSLIDKVYGEWFWGIDENGRPMINEDKAGLWKCPYHNGRALMEIIRQPEINIY